MEPELTVIRTAWFPDDEPVPDFERGAAAATAWILEESEQQGRRPLLITPHQNQQQRYQPAAIVSFAANHESTTPRGSARVVPARGPRPVLTYVPDFQVMHLARRFAAGSSLAVVEEGGLSSLRGWAMQTGAINLRLGTATVDTRSDGLREALARIEWYGNNGWAPGFGRDQALRILRELQASEPLDRDVILGHMVARGKNDRAVIRLGMVVDKCQPAPISR